MNVKLKFRNDLDGIITAKDAEKRNDIINKSNERGYVTATDADFLLKFEKKTRVCNTCGRTFQEVQKWVLANALDKNGNSVNVGLHADCFDCEIKDIINLFKDLFFLLFFNIFAKKNILLNPLAELKS